MTPLDLAMLCFLAGGGALVLLIADMFSAWRYDVSAFDPPTLAMAPQSLWRKRDE